MNQGPTRLFVVLLAAAVLIAAGVCWAQTGGQAQSPQQKKVVEQQKQEEQQDYTEEEYDAYDQAVKEPDLAKRAAALIAFMEKYPKSKLREHIVAAYTALLFEYSKSGDFAKLETAAEQWLKYAPNDLQTMATIADSAQKLKHHQKFIEYGLKIFAQKPTAQLALAIYQSYMELKDEAKKTEWALKLMEYPEFNDNFELRMQFVAKYAEKDLPKAAEYAHLALKSLDIAKKPDATPAAAWNQGGHLCPAPMQQRHRHEPDRAKKVGRGYTGTGKSPPGGMLRRRLLLYRHVPMEFGRNREFRGCLRFLREGGAIKGSSRGHRPTSVSWTFIRKLTTATQQASTDGTREPRRS